MWFKNLHLLRFTKAFALEPEALAERLAHDAFRSVGTLEFHTSGWVAPLGDAEAPLVHAANGFIMLCARREERILPAAAVREAVEERAHAIEEETGRKVRGKARSALRDNIVQQMLPRAFTRSSRTFAYIDPKGGWLVIDSASAARAEELTGLLRDALESLPVEPPATASTPATIMTAWLQSGGVPAGFSIDDECDLHDTDGEGGVIRIRRQDLGSKEIRALLDKGKQVTRLGLSFEDRMAFVLDESLQVKRLRFLDMVQEEVAQTDADSDAERFDSDFAIMTLELSRFLPRLVKAFGGDADAKARYAA